MLNRVPAFCIVDEGERIVETVDVKGEKAIRWYVDPDEAKVALIVAQIMSPFTELHLSVTSLGHAYALAEGWTAADLEFPLRIEGSRSAVKGLNKALEDDSRADGEKLSDGCGVVPLFASEKLSTDHMMPFFFHPRDFLSTWLNAGLSAEKVPAQLAVTSLNKVVKLMLKGGPESQNLRNTLFVTGDQQAKTAGRCQELAQERQKKRTVMQMMKAVGLEGDPEEWMDDDEEEEWDDDDDDDFWDELGDFWDDDEPGSKPKR